LSVLSNLSKGEEKRKRKKRQPVVFDEEKITAEELSRITRESIEKLGYKLNV